ncbi:MAG: M20/M25/M40 family metallo-hydrolase [Treponema sp.]|nr:M20/M25/M40 family metallo-hydrolase [Treponema sp.]
MNHDFIEHFRTALRIKTDWPGNAKAGDNTAEKPLVDFQNYLAETFPCFHTYAERTVFSPYSIAYRWPGTGNIPEKTGAADSAPVLLLGHYDVVPAETIKWSFDPFGAELKDDYIYGRGALDMKNIVISLMESAEILCRNGFKPKRDIWIVLGGDEERTGLLGAKKTAEWLEEKGLQFSFILDEGTPIAKDQIKGVNKPLALVGIEEKGFLSLDLSVDQKPGHASQPPEEQSAAILSRALLRISQQPFPWHLTPAVEAFFRQLGLQSSGTTAFVMKHARMLGPLFFKAAGVSPATKALLRTTIAMTQLEGSSADNVLPSTVKAVINLRLLPPWTTEKVIERIKTVIADDRVSVTDHSLGTDPVESGPDQETGNSPGWKEIKGALGNVFADIPVLPFLMLATTDSRHYQNLSKYIFRFSPMLLNPEELSRIHGHDERISLENLEHCLQFYTNLMEQL